MTDASGLIAYNACGRLRQHEEDSYLHRTCVTMRAISPHKTDKNK